MWEKYHYLRKNWVRNLIRSDMCKLRQHFRVLKIPGNISSFPRKTGNRYAVTLGRIPIGNRFDVCTGRGFFPANQKFVESSDVGLG